MSTQLHHTHNAHTPHSNTTGPLTSLALFAPGLQAVNHNDRCCDPQRAQTVSLTALHRTFTLPIRQVGFTTKHNSYQTLALNNTPLSTTALQFALHRETSQRTPELPQLQQHNGLSTQFLKRTNQALSDAHKPQRLLLTTKSHSLQSLDRATAILVQAAQNPLLHTRRPRRLQQAFLLQFRDGADLLSMVFNDEDSHAHRHTPISIITYATTL